MYCISFWHVQCITWYLPQGDIIVLEDHNHCIVPLAHDEVGGIKNIAWNSIPPVTASAFFSHYDDNAKQEVSYIVTAV